MRESVHGFNLMSNEFSGHKCLLMFFQVNLEGNKLRRQHPIGDVPDNVDSRTVYVVKRVLSSYFHLFFFSEFAVNTTFITLHFGVTRILICWLY